MSRAIHISPPAIFRPQSTSTPIAKIADYTQTAHIHIHIPRAATILAFKGKRPSVVSFASVSSESASPEFQSPQIELQFIGPKVGVDNAYPVDNAKAVSGQKLLRNVMLDNKLELYATYGKMMNCGGGGSCGTCIVEILEGKDLLNERTNTELRYLKKKPESWRLACQTIVGNKENYGKVVVQRLPQWKK